MKRAITYSFAMVLLFTLGCMPSTPKFDLGEVKDNVYRNEYFNFEINLNENWKVLTREETNVIIDMGMAVNESNKNGQKISAEQVKNAALLAVFKFPFDSLVPFNPNMMVMVENLRSAVSIKDGGEYLQQLKKGLQQHTALQYDITERIGKLSYGGKDFYVLSSKVKNPMLDNELYQDYYVTIINRFALSIIVSYDNSPDQKELQAMLESIAFTNTETEQ